MKILSLSTPPPSSYSIYNIPDLLTTGNNSLSLVIFPDSLLKSDVSACYGDLLTVVAGGSGLWWFGYGDFRKMPMIFKGGGVVCGGVMVF